MSVGFLIWTEPPQVNRRGRIRTGCAARRRTECGLRRSKQPIGNRTGFTLVEMLIVVAIVAIIVALGVGALLKAPQQARIKGTEATIVKIEAKLSALISEFNRGRFNISPIGTDTIMSGAIPIAQRARVIAGMRAMRQSFPEMFYIDMARTSDGFNNDGDSLTNEPDEVIAGQWNPVDIDFDGNPNQAGTELPAAAVTYLQYMQANLARTPTFVSIHTPGTARAECLFMIVTKCGTDTADFSAEEMKDTDGDGLLEFVDKFGNPIQFFLWPSYHGGNPLRPERDTGGSPTPAWQPSDLGSSLSPKQNPGSETDPDDPNQFLTQADWWNAAATATDARPVFERLFHTLTHFMPGSGGWQPKGFRTYPLIVSAGPDGGFGFRGDPAFVGSDGVMGTLDDTDPSSPTQLRLPAIGLMLSVGPNGAVQPSPPLDDGSPALATGPVMLRPLRVSAAMRITDPSVDGYGQEDDNIDNHRLRPR